VLNLTKKEMAAILAKVRKRSNAEAAARCKLAVRGGCPGLPSFADREKAYAELHPHLLEQRHCGLCPDSEAPRRKIKLPNGLVIHSSWYKVPTGESDGKIAIAEQRWLLANEPEPAQTLPRLLEAA
jgi:hypothetical protein